MGLCCRSAAAIVAATVLTACVAGAPSGPATGFREVDAARARLAFEVPALAGVDPVRVAWRDPRQREEYALFRGAGGAQAEVVLLEALPGAGAVLDLDLMVADGVRAFARNADTAIDWGASRFVDSPFGGTWVQPYRLPAPGRACVGFATTWDVAADDPERRPARALFGYFCAAEGEALSDVQAATLATRVEVTGVTRRRRIESAYELRARPAAPLPPPERQAELAVLAQDGAPGSRAGLPAFPLRRARTYQVAGETDRG